MMNRVRLWLAVLSGLRCPWVALLVCHSLWVRWWRKAGAVSNLPDRMPGVIALWCFALRFRARLRVLISACTGADFDRRGSLCRGDGLKSNTGKHLRMPLYQGSRSCCTSSARASVRKELSVVSATPIPQCGSRSVANVSSFDYSGFYFLILILFPAGYVLLTLRAGTR